MRVGWIGAICVGLVGCGPSGDPVGLSGALAPPVATPAAAAGSSPDVERYRITRGDTLDVTIYQVPDLSRAVQVDGAGQVVLPLIGSVPAAGKTVREFEGDVTKRYGARYLQNPQVLVSLKDAVGHRVTIDGAVKKPGVIQATGDATLLRALAEANGFTDTADLSAVIVFRQTEKGRTAARFDVNAIRAGTAPDPRIYGGDTIVVDESGAKTAWKQFREALPVTGLFRLF